MATFNDPLRTVTFEHPAGWANDLLYSTLTDLFFARWDRPEEMLVVHLRRACVSEDQSYEQWLEQIQAEVGEKTSLFNIDTPNGRAVAVDFVSKEGMTQRVAFLRGEHVDITVEQRNADTNASDPWKALDQVIKSVVSETNKKQTGTFGAAEFNKTVEEANKAFEKKDYTKVVSSLQDAIHIGSNAWLASLKSPSGSPEINAAVRVAQAMVHLGHMTGDAFLSRNAASILRRSLCSLEAAGKATMEQAEGLVAELNELLDTIQSELMDKVDPNANQDSAPIVSIRERGFLLTQAAAGAFDAGDFNSASIYAGAAVEDILFLLAYFRRGRAQQIPGELLQNLVDQGISDHEEQRDVIQKAREGILFPALNLSLQIRFCGAMKQGDPEGASESTSLLTPLARQIFDSSSGDTSIALNLALALMNDVGVIAVQKDKNRLQEASEYVDEACRVLDEIGEQHCQKDGWVRSHKQQTEMSIEALNQWLSAVKEGEHASLESDLKAIHSKFESTAEKLRDKITESPKTEVN